MTDGDEPVPGEDQAPDEVPDPGLTAIEEVPDGAHDSWPAAESGEERHRPGGGQPARRYALARAGFIEYDRVVFFSDAVFAIAITLLAVGLRRPPLGPATGAPSLFGGGVGNSLLGFGISFAVIGLFWLGHHGLFRYIVAMDRPLIALNLFFLGAIAFLPYPTRILATNGNRASVVIFYAACAGVAGLAEAAIWLYATARPSLVDPSAQSVRLLFALRVARIPAVFAISIPVAVAAPQLAQYVWILILVAGGLINRIVPAAAG